MASKIYAVVRRLTSPHPGDNERDAHQALCSMLKHPNGDVASLAAGALVVPMPVLDDPLVYLRLMVQHSHLEVRLHAIAGLLRLPPGDARDGMLRTLLDRENDTQFCAQAACALAEYAQNQKPVFEELLRQLHRYVLHADAEVRCHALRGIACNDDPRRHITLAMFSCDADDSVRQIVAGLYAQNSLQNAPEVLTAMAQDSSWRVRCEVAKATAHHPSVRISVLERLAGDHTVQVRREACKELARCLDNQAIVILATMQTDDAPQLQLSSRRAKREAFRTPRLALYEEPVVRGILRTWAQQPGIVPWRAVRCAMLETHPPHRQWAQYICQDALESDDAMTRTEALTLLQEHMTRSWQQDAFDE